MPKVTVVVPTYRSNEHLDDLVASVDAQSMPQEDIEVLLIDDGSPDDTYARLQEFARARPNYRAIALPPSGWPSRPRNHGIDEATGEYIVFIDHDDRLYPDALRAAHALASRAGADVLDGKESKSNTPGWAMRDLDADVENAIDWVEPHPLLPMNPHKMFRTQFLRDQGIRFPEGGRQIWEDISFDISAHARAEVVSLLVETPFYHWNRPRKATTSATFQNDLGEYLAAIERVFDWVDAELQQPRFAELYPRFLAYQLRMRVLPLFARSAKRTDEEREQVRAFTARLLTRVPVAADACLDPWRRIKVALLRAGRFDLVDRHEATVPRLVCTAHARDPRWDATGLRFDAAIEWELRAGDAPAVRREGDRLMLQLDPAVAEFARAHDLTGDVTDDIAESSYAIERRSRSQKIDWGLGRGTAPAAGDPATGPLIAGTVTVAWALEGDSRLHSGAWDFHIRTVILWTRVVRAIRSDLDAPSWAAIDGHVVAVYRSQAGNLAVDVDQQVLTAADGAEKVTASVRAGRAEIRAELPQVRVFEDALLEGDLVDASGETVGRCRIVASGGVAYLEADAPVGTDVGFCFGGAVSPVRWRVHRGGQVSVRRVKPPQPSIARRVWQRVPASLRRDLWLWRHGRRS